MQTNEKKHTNQKYANEMYSNEQHTNIIYKGNIFFVVDKKIDIVKANHQTERINFAKLN